jgi:RNA polymerase sigma-70 factor, ECF subfamily
MDIQANASFRGTIPLNSNGDASTYVGDAASLKKQHLVLAARSGCRESFNELWDLYSLRIYRTLLRMTKNTQDAEDALQNTFLHAFLGIERFEGRANFYTWLTRIAINSVLGMQRKRRCRPEFSLDSTFRYEDEGPREEFRDLAPDPEQFYAVQEEREKLMQAVRKLPAGLRITTQALIAENCSVKEVADRLNISESAAKSRLYRARRIMLSSLTAARYAPKSKIAVF